MNARHTPGPWRNDFGVEISAGECVSICGMRFPFNDDPEKAANACLISAAPELLEAVERLEAGVRLWMSRGVTDEDMAFAKAAILKAKGGAR